MAKTKAFNNASIAGSTTGLTTAAFVSGSGVFTPALNKKDVTTADGNRHYIPYEKGGTASFSVYGNLLHVNTPAGLGVAIILKLDSSTVYSGTGLVTASYNDIEDQTKIDIKFDPA